MNQTDIALLTLEEWQSLTPEEYDKWLDQFEDLTDMDRSYCKARFELDSLTIEVQGCINEFRAHLSFLYGRLDEIEQRNLKISEQGLIIDSVLVAPERKDVN